MNCLYPFTVISLLFILNNTYSQTSYPSNQSSLENIKEYFRSEIGEDAHLYTGKEYPAYKSGIRGTPFYISPQMQNSDLFYDGTLYKDVPLLFDLVRQEIVINRFDDNTRMKLLKEKVKYFKIAGHHFENINLGEEDSGDIYSGFFEIALDGRASVLVSRRKKIEMTLNPDDPPKFVERDNYFIRNGNNLYAVNKISSILNALKDKKDVVRTFIRKNKFRFKNDIEKELIATAAYYETLIK